MLHDDVTIPYLATMIDHGRHIRWLQKGGALKGRPHQTYNTCMISNSAAEPPRYMTQHIHDVVNDESSIGISAHRITSRSSTGGAANITLSHERRDRHSSCATLPWVHTPPVAEYTEHDHYKQPTSAGSSLHHPAHTQDMPQPG